MSCLLTSTSSAGGTGPVLPLQLHLLAQQLRQADLADRQVEHRVEHGLEPRRMLLDRPDVGPEMLIDCHAFTTRV